MMEPRSRPVLLLGDYKIHHKFLSDPMVSWVSPDATFWLNNKYRLVVLTSLRVDSCALKSLGNYGV